MAVNYQLELERELQKNEGKTPRLLLHCCCAPCSSYVLEYLSPHFSITAHYYNPNIDTPEEYAHRARELSRFVQEMPLPGAVDVLGGALHARRILRGRERTGGHPRGRAPLL